MNSQLNYFWDFSEAWKVEDQGRMNCPVVVLSLRWLTVFRNESSFVFCCCCDSSDFFFSSSNLFISVDNTCSTFSYMSSSNATLSMLNTLEAAAAAAAPLEVPLGSQSPDDNLDCTSVRWRSSWSSDATMDGRCALPAVTGWLSWDSMSWIRCKTDWKWTESWSRTWDCKPSLPICYHHAHMLTCKDACMGSLDRCPADSMGLTKT